MTGNPAADSTALVLYSNAMGLPPAVAGAAGKRAACPSGGAAYCNTTPVGCHGTCTVITVCGCGLTVVASCLAVASQSACLSALLHHLVQQLPILPRL
jgi:hypothetical protein